jgi:hypothetical protein
MSNIIGLQARPDTASEASDDDFMSFDSDDQAVRTQGKQPQRSKSGKLSRLLKKSESHGDQFYHEKGAEVKKLLNICKNINKLFTKYHFISMFISITRLP